MVKLCFNLIIVKLEFFYSKLFYVLIELFLVENATLLPYREMNRYATFIIKHLKISFIY